MDHPGIVLLVDDLEPPRNFLRVYLEAEGYRVMETSDAREAMRAMRALRPDAVVCELRLPGPGGLQLMEAMRRQPELREIPVFLVGRDLDEETRQHAEMLGAEACLPKPVEPGVLLPRLRQALD